MTATAYITVIIVLMTGWIAPSKVLAQEIIAVRKDGAGGALTSISAAVNAIPKKPDTHYVVEIQDSETYEESVVIKKKSKESATLVVRAQPGQQPRIISSKKKKPAIQIASPYVTVDGLILQGGSRQAGVHIKWADFSTISNCTISGTRDKNTPGIYVQGGSNGQFVDNVITDNEVGILVFNRADENTIRNNLIYENRSHGIWLYRKNAGNQVVKP